MGKNRKPGGRHIILSVLMGVGGCFRIGIDAPLLRQPSAIEQITGGKGHDAD